MKHFFKKHNRIIAAVTLMLLSIIFLILLYLPADFFDNGKSICLSKVIANRECYARGMTRGIQHLIHLEFETAWNFNKLSFIVFPLIMFAILKELLPQIFNKKN